MERKDKEKRKKKKEKTKLLLGCVTVPSSNDESYVTPGVDPGVDAASTIAAAAAALSDADDKKAEKRRKKLAKIATRNEKKELKKREKLNKKLGKLELEDEGTSVEKKTEKKAKKKSEKVKNQPDDHLGGGAPTPTPEGKLTSIGDDSVVVVELPLEDHVKTAVLNGTTNGDEATTRCGAMELLKKKKKKKRKAEDEVEVDGDCKKKKKKRKKDKENLDEGKEEGTGMDASVAVDPSVKKEKKKCKKNKKRESVALNDSIDSADVSALMSPAPPPLPSCPPPSIDVSSSDVQAKKKKKSKKRDESCEIAPPAKGVTDVAPTAKPNSSVNDSSSKESGENPSTPTAPERPSKKRKKSKVLLDAEASAGSDVDTPTKAIKTDLITELKTKVKDRKKPLATPSPLPDAKTVTKAADGDDQVFATPTKAVNGSAAPARIAMGQWGKVELGSTEKTQKFFRLLGGMKKPTGSPLSFRSSKGSNSTVDGGGTPEAEKAIMAMGKKDADILNNKLEEQFKKALGGIGKGKVGLGFSPQLDPANKKFHIDVNATKSVKF